MSTETTSTVAASPIAPPVAAVQTNGTTAGNATGTVVFLNGGMPLSTNHVSGGVAYSLSASPRLYAGETQHVFLQDGCSSNCTAFLREIRS